MPVTPAARNIPAVPAAIPAAPASPIPPPGQPARSPGQRTQLVGGSGGFAFEASHPQQQAAIGFRYALGNWAGTEGLSQLQPLYASEPDAPNQVVARDGYIVAGLEVDADQFVEAVRILFARQTADGRIETVRVTPDGSPVANYAFDVTPARLVTGLITERGVCAASRDGLRGLFPERGEAGRGR